LWGRPLACPCFRKPLSCPASRFAGTTYSKLAVMPPSRTNCGGLYGGATAAKKGWPRSAPDAGLGMGEPPSYVTHGGPRARPSSVTVELANGKQPASRASCHSLRAAGGLPKKSRHSGDTAGILVSCPPEEARGSSGQRLQPEWRSVLPRRGARPMNDVTRILSAIDQGDPLAAQQLCRWSTSSSGSGDASTWAGKAGLVLRQSSVLGLEFRLQAEKNSPEQNALPPGTEFAGNYVPTGAHAASPCRITTSAFTFQRKAPVGT